MVLEGRALRYGHVVWIDHRRVTLTHARRLVDDEVSGFNWGYHGAGPQLLALAILLEVGIDEMRAVKLHRYFARDILQPIPTGTDWRLELDVRTWAYDVERAHDAGLV